ncbi:hypothetical protein [Neorhodopirellula pilleata]|uniref:Uncharacterized protein n=1 Tax=Neorhodopirellula pilleata TaxID=2714738 RepID=A0A5C5ZZK7_9BACT|nr:hypothetical protein [Neorhodopirellula pilleata]TWT93004.1 hypothetical protein Pla100_43200 [Neorhodopirellula pilleata]
MNDVAALPSCPTHHVSTHRRKHRRRWLAAIAVVSVGAVVSTIPSLAGFPEAITRSGRLCGCGYGDGYHACYSSGIRPLANLPPRSFPARIGTDCEKFHGCPQCGNAAFAGVDPMRSPTADTFYHRFDRYAWAVSQNAANVRPMKPLVDPEESAGHYYSQLDPDGNQREYSTRSYPSPFASESMDHSVLRAEAPTNPPQMTEHELAEYREYLEQKRLQKKFDKYLIDPSETEPNQIIGGPPVGSEERRRIDESKVEQLKARMRRELAAEAESAAEAQRQAEQSRQPSPDQSRDREDSLPSPSDRSSPRDGLSPSILEMESSLEDELPVPLEQLLPPMNDTLPGEDTSLDPIDDPLIPTYPEPIPRGWEDQLDDADSAKPSSLHQTRSWIHQPSETTRVPRSSSLTHRSQYQNDLPREASEDSSHRIAALSRVKKLPPKTNFVKQPD